MPAADVPQKRAAVVYNPLKVDLDALKASVHKAAADSGWRETLWLETSQEDPGQGVARDALREQVDVVLAAGGDGTVRAVAEALRGSDVVLALLPAGTGNVLARNLNLTLDDLDHSVSTAFTGVNRSVDLGIATLIRPDQEAEKHAFVVMAGLGLDAEMVANTDDDLKRKVGWLAYVQAIARSIKGDHRMRVQYQLDDAKPRRSRIHTILVGNCGSLPGNILLLPEAAVDDGILDIVALRPEGLAGWFQIWARIVVENGILRRTEAGKKLTSATKEIRALRYLRGERLRVTLSQPEEVELDGDEFGKVIALEVHVQGAALLIRVPAET